MSILVPAWRILFGAGARWTNRPANGAIRRMFALRAHPVNPSGIRPLRSNHRVVFRSPRPGFVPGFPGAHSQGETLDELNSNLKEVVEMLLEDGEPKLEGEFFGTQNVMVA